MDGRAFGSPDRILYSRCAFLSLRLFLNEPLVIIWTTTVNRWRKQLLPVPKGEGNFKPTYLRAPTELANILADLAFSAILVFLFKILFKNFHGDFFYRGLIFFMFELRCEGKIFYIYEPILKFLVLESRRINSIRDWHRSESDVGDLVLFELFGQSFVQG